MSFSAKDKVLQKDRESLAKDYAQLSILLEKFDQQVAKFVQTTQDYTHQTAPACAGLTELWSQQQHQQQQAAVDHATSSSNDNTSKGQAKSSHRESVVRSKVDISSSNDDPLVFIQR